MRTWAPRGQTPLLPYHFRRWEILSVMAGITWRNFYFRIYRNAVRTAQVIEFLAHLQRHLPRRLLIIWDNHGPHRSKALKRYVAAQGGRLTLEFLPGYAPELNPVEYIWAHLKQHELANLCPADLWALGAEARRALRNMRRRPTLVRAFWIQAELF